MCTSYVHRRGGILIGMNFDSDGMAYKVDAGPGAFVVKVNGGWGLKPSFGVTADGLFANNLMVDAPPNGLGAYKRASATRTHTQALAERFLTGQFSGTDIPAVLARMEIVNGPGHSCHNLLVDSIGNAFVVEPGRGVLESPADGSPFFVMTNCPLCGLAPGAMPTGDGEGRHRTATALLEQAGEHLSVAGAFEILRQTAQTGGDWQTVFSMVYSAAERVVYYCTDRQFDRPDRHAFA